MHGTTWRKLARGIDPRRAGPRKRHALSGVGLSAEVPGDLRHTVEHLVQDYIERHAAEHHKRPEYTASILRREVLAAWKGRDARSITSVEVLDLLDSVLDRRSKVMANRLASLLSHSFGGASIGESSRTRRSSSSIAQEGVKNHENAPCQTQRSKLLLSVEALPRWDRLHRVMNLLLLTGQRRVN